MGKGSLADTSESGTEQPWILDIQGGTVLAAGAASSANSPLSMYFCDF